MSRIAKPNKIFLARTATDTLFLIRAKDRRSAYQVIGGYLKHLDVDVAELDLSWMILEKEDFEKVVFE